MSKISGAIFGYFSKYCWRIRILVSLFELVSSCCSSSVICWKFIFLYFFERFGFISFGFYWCVFMWVPF